ncbi:metallophosphoesterase [Sinorhizobium sp. Sb3]|uniref:metallophosphoesterase n=1 Tax=Sinorhizobium sp. Sb3 TaxID=1358417 RepID=UPI00071E5962|nr:metallophosphoesterase [Sinorhizobium sp. Sb3]
MFHLAKALLCLFVIIRFLLPLPWPKAWKVVAAVLLMVVFQHSLISLLVFGTMLSPEVPRQVMIAANWISGIILLLAAFQLLSDLTALTLAALRRRHVLIPTLIRYAGGVVAIALTAFGVSQAIRVPPAKEIELPVRGLPEEFDGYRIVHLTDLHISRLFHAPWVEATVERTNAQQADLIVITGDLIDGDLHARHADIAPLQRLRAKDGVFAIPGNHEYYFGHDLWMRQYASLGMTTLSNEHVLLSRSGATLALAGVNDLTAPRFGLPGPDFVKALKGVPPSAPVVLLNHQPKEARLAAKAGVDLQLSGHTHGGMILGFDRLVAQFNNGFVSGRYSVGDMELYVNNGTALWIGFAIRLGKPSELTVIKLRRR